MIEVVPGDPGDPGASALLAQSHALMQRLFPAESNHYLEIADLQADHIVFLVAREGERTLGTGALSLRDGHAEVKSMFVDPDARGRGIAALILKRIEQEARARGVLELKLETGALLAEAHRLYARHGFHECGAFGDYPADDPNSLFMAKRLD